jgi:hypothetical protein
MQVSEAVAGFLDFLFFHVFERTFSSAAGTSYTGTKK